MAMARVTRKRMWSFDGWICVDQIVERRGLRYTPRSLVRFWNCLVMRINLFFPYRCLGLVVGRVQEVRSLDCRARTQEPH